MRKIIGSYKKADFFGLMLMMVCVTCSCKDSSQELLYDADLSENIKLFVKDKNGNDLLDSLNPLAYHKDDIKVVWNGVTYPVRTIVEMMIGDSVVYIEPLERHGLYNWWGPVLSQNSDGCWLLEIGEFRHGAPDSLHSVYLYWPDGTCDKVGTRCTWDSHSGVHTQYYYLNDSPPSRELITIVK